MKFVVPPAGAANRLDAYLAKEDIGLSRSSIQKLCEQGKVTVNGEVSKPKLKLSAGDKVAVDYDLDQASQIPTIVMPIVYEDDNCLVIDKPAGILTHSKGNFNPEATVATFIAPKTTGMTGDRAGIVHRLDRATSGLIICAKDPETLAFLQKQFSQHKVKKTYLAVVSGHLNLPAATIDIPIARSPRNPKTFRPDPAGKPAQTEYRVLQPLGHNDLLQLNPLTGRTHQLRVHLHHLGHPIIGDTFYEGQPADRLYLHATKLELTLPGGVRRVFESKPDPGFLKVN